MTILSKRLFRRLAAEQASRFALRPRIIDRQGALVDAGRRHAVDVLPVVQQARAHALSESVRWGEPYIFLLAPGILSWMVAIVRAENCLGGLVGGEVLAGDEAQDRHEAVAHLTEAGCPRAAAQGYVQRLPAWPQPRIREAADWLFLELYRAMGSVPRLLLQNREVATQQRQIAEEIHRRKERPERSSPLEDERLLLSLIRAGDRKGARRVLNRMLGTVFLRSGNQVVVRALMIEMMGYLVRTAVEDSPYLEPLLEKNHVWMARIIEASDFEALAAVMRGALDDFMQNVYVLGYRPAHAAVHRALEYLREHFAGEVRLAEVARAAGLSTYRIAHLVKEHTGKSIVQHAHRLRVQEARRLLEQTSMACAEIAYETGFGDQSYFTKQFRLLTGSTPARYRRAHGGTP